MKNIVKLFGIVALVAAIGFSMISCGGDDGGGVRIAGNGTFIMNGGTIEGNVTKHLGGGVYVGPSGTGKFYMYDGYILGEDTLAFNSIFSYSNGTAVHTPSSIWVGEGGGTVAQWGKFVNGVWQKKGDLTTSDKSIMVNSGEKNW